MLTVIPVPVASLYRNVCVRGWRITRLEEKLLEFVRLDASTAWELGTQNLGLFVGGCQPLGDTVARLTALERTHDAPCWAVVAATKKMAAVITQRWFLGDAVTRVSASSLQAPRVHANIVLATPETLNRIDCATRRHIAGIILVDMLCHVHAARGMKNRGFVVHHDRPQVIADFRNDLRQDGWCPPLILLTQRRAKSVGSSAIARAYCLDGWWFVDGQTLRCDPVQLAEAKTP